MLPIVKQQSSWFIELLCWQRMRSDCLQNECLLLQDTSEAKVKIAELTRSVVSTRKKLPYELFYIHVFYWSLFVKIRMEAGLAKCFKTIWTIFRTQKNMNNLTCNLFESTDYKKNVFDMRKVTNWLSHVTSQFTIWQSVLKMLFVELWVVSCKLI